MCVMLRVGQRWRQGDGKHVTIDGLDGDSASISVSVSDPATLVVAANALHRSAFDSMVLLSDPVDPAWIVTVSSGPSDWLHAALERIGTVEASRTHTPVPGGLGAWVSNRRSVRGV